MLSRINKYPVPFVILALLLVEFIINPIGEFPLNDDWAFSRVIYNYLNTGIFKFSDWQSLPLVPQLFTGIAVTKVFGFSFTALRLISLISLVLIITFLDKILNLFNIQPTTKVIALLSFTFNPLTLSLANTFLPDIFTLLFIVIGAYYMFKLLKTYNPIYFIAFCLLSFLATLNRQTSIILPIAFAILFILRNPTSYKTIVTGTVAAIICAIGLLAFPIICKQLNMLPVNYELQLPRIIDSIEHPSLSLIKSFGYYFITSTLLLGIFMLPFTIPNYKEHLTQLKDSWTLKLVLAAYLGIIFIKLFIFHNYLPFIGNMFYPYGVGPIIMTGIETYNIHPVSSLAKLFWSLFNIAGGISFFSFLSIILTKPNKTVNTTLFIFILLIGYLIPLCFSYVNDRYLLLLVPFFFLAYLQSAKFNTNKLLLTLCIITCIGISTETTYDYLCINRTRWQATNKLIYSQHISPENIDGGFEFNGWYSQGFKNYNPLHTGRWWWVNNDTYVISPLPLKGYIIQESIPLHSCISFRFHNLYILKRN